MTDLIADLARRTVVDHLRNKVCVDPDTGLRRLPNYLDDEIFRIAIGIIEHLPPVLDVAAWAMLHPDDPSRILKIEHDPITVEFMKAENKNCTFIPLYRTAATEADHG